MSYVPKPGSISLFKNQKKEKPSHPDYRGDGADLDGKPVWVSAWLKDGKKGKYLSISMQHKDTAQPNKVADPNHPGHDDEIGF